MKKLTNKEMIKAIKDNYPPSNYTMLIEALDYSMVLLDKETNGIYISNEVVSELLEALEELSNFPINKDKLFEWWNNFNKLQQALGGK